MRLSLYNKIIFYFSYFVYKTLLLWFEVHTPKVKMFIYEMFYSIEKLFDKDFVKYLNLNISYVATKFGRFRIRANTIDTACVSPAYERRDINFLFKTINNNENYKKILFLDVGADIGTYSIVVGNKFKKNNRVNVIGFEPFKTSFSLFEQNIGLNGLSNIQARNYALSDKAGTVTLHYNDLRPGSSGIVSQPTRGNSFEMQTKTLDEVVMEIIDQYDLFIIKMDVEGMERFVLEGGRRLFGTNKKTYLLVEDFINPELTQYLYQSKFVFINKLTPYNSWWTIN